MTEENGVWLSTSRPPKLQQTSSKRQKSVLKCKPYNKTTTFFSATLTQNSPPPPQLFTSRKQSYLTDFFRKGCENVISCENTSGQTSNISNTTADVTLDCTLFKQPNVEGYAEPEMVGASSEPLENSSEKRKSTKSGVNEKCDDHFDKLEQHCLDVTLMSSDDSIKDSIHNEDIDLFENPAKVLRLQHVINSSRLDHNTSVLEEITNYPSVKANLANNTDFGCGHESGSLTFTQTQTSLGLNSKDDLYFNGSDFNKDFFHARKQKHYKDMETLQFTEDSTT